MNLSDKAHRAYRTIKAKLDPIISPKLAVEKQGSSNRYSGESSIPISTYPAMFRDAEVASDFGLALHLMLPDIHFSPQDGDEKSKKAAEFCENSHNAMPGAPLEFYRDMILHDTCAMGFSVSELVMGRFPVKGYSNALGIVDVIVANSEDFISGGIKTDKHGRITGFKQGISNPILAPEDVIFFSLNATSGHPEGVSILYPAVPPWVLKKLIFRNLGYFITTNATGIKKFKLPPSQFEAEKDNALSLLARLSETGRVVQPDNWELDLDIPPGDAGNHFVRILQEICNKEIRKTILYDETITAEGMHTWGEAGKETSTNLVKEIMLTRGNLFCEKVIKEQICRKLLDVNGFESYPTPKIHPEKVQRNAPLAPILISIGDAQKSGVLGKASLDPDTQRQIIERMLEPAGIEFDASKEEEVAPQKEEKNEEKKPPETTDESERKSEQIAARRARFKRIAARAPADRNLSKVRQMDKDRLAREDAVVSDIDNLWKQELQPKIASAINSAVFDRKGNVRKDKSVSAFRESVEKGVTTGGGKLRALLSDALFKEWELAYGQAEEEIAEHSKRAKVKARITTGPRITPTLAKEIIRQRIYFVLQKEYTQISSNIWQHVEGAITGNIPSSEAMSLIEEGLIRGGFSQGTATGRAVTIVRTESARAYNHGRLASYSQHHDPFGMEPGTIKGYCVQATLDDRTTEFCENLHMEFFRCNDPNMPWPPFHYNCRTVMLPVYWDEEPWNDKNEFLSQEESAKVVQKYGGVMEGFGAA